MGNKILFFVNSFRQGGRERRLIQLLKGLCVRGDYELHVALFNDDIFYEEVKEIDIKLHNLSDARTIYQRYMAIKSLMSKVNPDIVHSWLGNVIDIIFVTLRWKFHYKYIAGYVADGIKLKRSSISYFAHKISFWGADAIVSNSHSGLVAKGAPASKSYVIFNGFDNNRIPHNFDKTAKRKSLGVTDANLVCMVARFTPQKDYNMFLNVAQLALQEGNVSVFLAVGDGELLESCKLRAKRENISNVRFLGSRSDVEEILSTCDLSVLFSCSSNHAEGISNSIMESLALGVPVIATNGGGTPEIIEHGENGYLVSDGDTVAAYSYIRRLLNNSELMQHMQNNARQIIEERFSLDRMVRDYNNLYFTLIRK